MKPALCVISSYNSGDSHGCEWCLCQRKSYYFSEFLQGRQTLGNMLRGPEARICCSAGFSLVTCPFLRKCSFAGTNFYPRDMLHEIQLVCSRGKMTSVFTTSHAVLLQTVPGASVGPLRTHEKNIYILANK